MDGREEGVSYGVEILVSPSGQVNQRNAPIDAFGIGFAAIDCDTVTARR